MKLRSIRALGMAVLGLAACNAFPESLGRAIASPDGGGPSGTDGGASGNDGGASDADGASPASRYRVAVMNDEPIAYWRLGEPGAGGVAKDETSHGHDGQYSGPGVAFGTAGALAGDVDTAVTFVDGSAKITMPMGIDFDGVKPFTVELWFRASSMNTQVGYIVDHAQYTPVRTGWTVRVGDSANFERWVNDSTVDAIGKPAPVDGQWHHLVAVFDGAQQPAQQYLYLDGRQSDVGGGDHALPPLGAPFTVGRQNCTCAGSNTAFIGDLDELAIYDKALTLPAIQQHYAAAGRQ